MFRVALARLAAAAALAIPLAFASPAQALEAYLFRGAGDFSFIAKGLTFSNGMDRLADQIEAQGTRATVYRWESMERAYREIMSRRPDSVALMGHSMGALASITLANRLKGSGIRVAYMGLIDIPGPGAQAPSNVEVAQNFYHAFPVFGLLGKGRGFQGKLTNNYVFGQVHITMDKSSRVHNEVLAALSTHRQIEALPTLQAYAAAPEPVTARVDRLLTGSTSKAKSSATDLPGAAPEQALAALPVEPAQVPIPQPSPRRM